MNTDTFMTIIADLFLELKMFSYEGCGENQNTNFISNNVFPKIVPFMRCVEIL